MNSTTVPAGCRSHFTPTQWQELEHQALVFKYMMAGIPVPPDLLLFIRKSFETMATRFYHHPASSVLGYCSLYGKKIDPEPGRCRRTDGKKWRCSKDAYPDSKYCERHMHRGRNRSRKPVETKTTLSLPTSPSSTVTAVTPKLTANGTCYQTTAIPFQAHPSLSSSSYGGHNLRQLQMDQGASSYSVIGAKDYRYTHAVKSEEDRHSLLTRASKLDSTWPLLASPVRNGSAMSASYAQQHCFFGNEEYGTCASVAGTAIMTETIKNETQSLRPFFDEWPKPRDSWSGLEGERNNMNSTQLSISMPITSSDFSATSSTSPNQ